MASPCCCTFLSRHSGDSAAEWARRAGDERAVPGAARHRLGSNLPTTIVTLRYTLVWAAQPSYYGKYIYDTSILRQQPVQLDAAAP